MVWQRLKVFWFIKDDPTGHSLKEREEVVDRGRGDMTILKSGQEWTLSARDEKQDKVEIDCC